MTQRGKRCEKNRRQRQVLKRRKHRLSQWFMGEFATGYSNGPAKGLDSHCRCHIRKAKKRLYLTKTMWSPGKRQPFTKRLDSPSDRCRLSLLKELWSERPEERVTVNDSVRGELGTHMIRSHDAITHRMRL